MNITIIPLTIPFFPEHTQIVQRRLQRYTQLYPAAVATVHIYLVLNSSGKRHHCRGRTAIEKLE